MLPTPSDDMLSPDRAFLTRSGLLYRTRAVRPSDEANLRDMFERCSRDDLRLRCFGLSKSFPATFAARLARAGDRGEFAIAAVSFAGGIGGVVHATGEAGEADYDIMVRTDLKGQGIGSRLMRDMLAEAARRGFSRVSGDVLVGNRAMLLLAGDLGFRPIATGGGVVRISTPASGAE